MRIPSVQVIAAAGWIAAICSVGLIANVESFWGWTLLVGFALLPPLGALYLWSTPRESMSESIQKALR